MRTHRHLNLSESEKNKNQKSKQTTNDEWCIYPYDLYIVFNCNNGHEKTIYFHKTIITSESCRMRFEQIFTVELMKENIHEI